MSDAHDLEFKKLQIQIFISAGNQESEEKTRAKKEESEVE
jgi:hypothetical protein